MEEGYLRQLRLAQFDRFRRWMDCYFPTIDLDHIPQGDIYRQEPVRGWIWDFYAFEKAYGQFTDCEQSDSG